MSRMPRFRSPHRRTTYTAPTYLSQDFVVEIKGQSVFVSKTEIGSVYHVVSRTALDGYPLGQQEKDLLLGIIQNLSSVYFCEVLGFCIMDNHFLCGVPHKK